MSDLISQSFGQGQNSNIFDDDNFENDDLFTFQHNSKNINLYYSQLIKYSKHIRETYLFSDVIDRLPQEIHQFQKESQLLPENIDFFFQLLEQNYNINDDLSLTYIQCIDLLKICKFLEVRKLSSKIKQYIKSRNIDVDFIIQMLEYEVQTQKVASNQQIEISNEIENILSNQINGCLSNEKFKELPIEIIYRVINKSSPNSINNNKLFDIIVKSLNKFCVLFPFLDLQKLSEDRLEDLCKMYSKTNENTQHCFNYLKCNLTLINELNNHKKNLEEMNDEQRKKMNDLEILLQSQLNDSNNLINEQQNKMNELETKITSLQNQLNDSKDLNNEQQNKMKDLETLLQKHFNDSEKVNAQLQSQLNDSEKVNSQLQCQLNDSKNLISEQQNKMNELETLLQKRLNEELENQIKYSKELENQVSQLQNKITEKEIADINKQLPFDGRIIASVEKGLFINAEIKLEINFGILDIAKSKVIISTSDAKYLGSEAYEKGEPITSLHMQISFARKTGRYYVRCIVFNTEGESNEIVSNSVATNGNCLEFDYEGKPAKISLPQGKYKLEVWGAKGGDSIGKGLCSSNYRGNMIVQGGLGGYSRGILNLNKKETIYVFVGEKGHPSNPSDGSITEGSFPDGGGTKTGHGHDEYPTVPGTGGGSTSIRIGNDTNYTRVIVAGGGGGAGGSYDYIDPGGFGGGLSGGNCSFQSCLKNQGAGTQIGSTRGLGEESSEKAQGDPGQFGLGATGKYMHGRDSGGGGGGGWYGGGSGGYGNTNCVSSGGGGSGWTFTEKCLKTFQSGDSSNASKFVLDSSYFLSDERCAGGNEEFPRPNGNGNEKGHDGNGYAKITPL